MAIMEGKLALGLGLVRLGLGLGYGKVKVSVMRLRVRLGVLFVAFISFLFSNYFYLFIFCLQKN